MDLKVNILKDVLENVPVGSIFHFYEENLSYMLKTFPIMHELLGFQISDFKKTYDDEYFIIISPESLQVFIKILKEASVFDMLNFYRIFDYGKTEVFLRVFDSNYFEISGKLCLKEDVINYWQAHMNNSEIFFRILETMDFSVGIVP